MIPGVSGRSRKAAHRRFTIPNIAALPAGSHTGPDWNNFPGSSWALNAAWQDSTGAYLRRLTDASSFGGNSSCAMEYATGGPRISQPFGANLDTYWIMFLVGGVPKAMKYTLGTGADVSTIRSVPPSSSGALSACFSMLSGEEHIVYTSQRAGAYIDRYDVNAGAYAPKTGFTSGANSAGFAHGGSSDAGWLQSSWGGQYIVFQSPFSSPTRVHYLDVVNATQTVTTYTTGLNEIAMLKGTTKAVIFKNGSDDAAWWFVDANKVTAFATATRSGHSDAGETSFYSWNPDTSYHPLWVQSTGTAPAANGDAWNGSVTARYDNDSSNVAGGGGHPSMAWNQTGAGSSEWYCYNVGYPNPHEADSWSVHSGSIYKSTPTLGGYGESTVGITSVRLWNGTTGSGSAITGTLTKAASLGAMTAGTWFWSAPTLYVWMADSTTPANKVQALYEVLTAGSCAYAKQDGSGTKRLCFTYHDSHDTTYEHTTFANWSPDGKLVVFNSNLGTYSGRVDLVAAEVPRVYL